jgi:membrane fusion protein (multidrug efflux system)
VYLCPVELSSETVGAIDGYVNDEIRARVRGYLEAQHFKDGAQVKAGQLLYSIESDEYAGAVAQAQGAAARARAVAQNADTQLKRATTLMQSNTIPQRQLDDAMAAAAEAAGQLAATQAALKRAQLDLSYTHIHSPLDGTAGFSAVRVGNLVGAEGPTLLNTVSRLDPMRVRFPISEIDYLRRAASFKALGTHDLAWAKRQFQSLSERGQTEDGDPGLELILSDGSVYPARGVIVASDRGVDPNTGTIRLEALFPNPDALLRPGQYGRVRMRATSGARESLVVAEKALLQVQGTYSLAVVLPDNKVELRKVEVGPTTGQERVILSGVKQGERVVVEGVQKVSDGALVEPSEAQASSSLPAGSGAAAHN